jgi:hypothetical protein
MARITPRITPYVPRPQNLSPKNIVRGKIRGLATGNAPIRVKIAVPRVSAITATAPKIKTMLQQTHTGRPPAANPKPKSPSQQTGIKTRPAAPASRTKFPSSVKPMRPGSGPSLNVIAKAQRRVQSATKPYKPPSLRSMMRV